MSCSKHKQPWSLNVFLPPSYWYQSHLHILCSAVIYIVLFVYTTIVYHEVQSAESPTNCSNVLQNARSCSERSRHSQQGELFKIHFFNYLCTYIICPTLVLSQTYRNEYISDLCIHYGTAELLDFHVSEVQKKLKCHVSVYSCHCFLHKIVCVFLLLLTRTVTCLTFQMPSFCERDGNMQYFDFTPN